MKLAYNNYLADILRVGSEKGAGERVGSEKGAGAWAKLFSLIKIVDKLIRVLPH